MRNLYENCLLFRTGKCCRLVVSKMSPSLMWGRELHFYSVWRQSIALKTKTSMNITRLFLISLLVWYWLSYNLAYRYLPVGLRFGLLVVYRIVRGRSKLSVFITQNLELKLLRLNFTSFYLYTAIHVIWTRNNLPHAYKVCPTVSCLICSWACSIHFPIRLSENVYIERHIYYSYYTISL